MNAPTKHDVRALVEQAETRLAALYPDVEPHGGGKRRTLRSMAFAEVADKLQIEVKTVRQQYRRAGLEPRRVRKEERERFDYLGVEVSEQFRRMLATVHSSLRTCSYALTASKANLTKLVGKYPMPAPLVQRTLVAIDEAAQLLKGLVPVGLCPWCKNVVSIREQCTTCHGSGFLPEAKKNIVPAALRAPGVTMRNGRLSDTDTTQQAAVPNSEPPPPPEEPMPWDL